MKVETESSISRMHLYLIIEHLIQANNEKLTEMQAEYEELESKIKQHQETLTEKREQYLKFNQRKEQFALAQGTLEALKEELAERTEHSSKLKTKEHLLIF